MWKLCVGLTGENVHRLRKIQNTGPTKKVEIMLTHVLTWFPLFPLKQPCCFIISIHYYLAKFSKIIIVFNGFTGMSEKTTPVHNIYTKPSIWAV